MNRNRPGLVVSRNLRIGLVVTQYYDQLVVLQQIYQKAAQHLEIVFDCRHVSFRCIFELRPDHRKPDRRYIVVYGPISNTGPVGQIWRQESKPGPTSTMTSRTLLPRFEPRFSMIKISFGHSDGTRNCSPLIGPSTEHSSVSVSPLGTYASSSDHRVQSF